MNIIKIALAAGLTMGVAACGGGPSKDEAQAGYAIAKGLATGAASTARSNKGGSLRSTETLTGVCQSGDISYTIGGTAQALDFSFSYNQCNLGGYVFDGTWKVTGSVESTKVVGGLSLTGPNLDFSCDFDLTVTAAGAVSGTACGYDVSELGG